MAILSKVWKPDSSEPHNFQKLTFINTAVHHYDFVDCKSFLESNSPDFLTLYEINLDDSVDFSSISVRSYFSLIWKQFCYSCLWRFNLWKVGTFLHMTCHLKTLRIFTLLCFWAALLHSPSYFFFTSQSLSGMMLFDLISKVLFVNPSAKDSLTYFNFSVLNKLMHHVNVPIWIPDHGLSTLLFVLKWSFIWRLCYLNLLCFSLRPTGAYSFSLYRFLLFLHWFGWSLS